MGRARSRLLTYCLTTAVSWETLTKSCRFDPPSFSEFGQRTRKGHLQIGETRNRWETSYDKGASASKKTNVGRPVGETSGETSPGKARVVQGQWRQEARGETSLHEVRVTRHHQAAERQVGRQQYRVYQVETTADGRNPFRATLKP